MKDEIKEILAKIKDSINETPKRMFKYNKITFNLEESQVLLDYITNLQQENQDIKDTLQDKLDYIGHLKELCDKYEEEHNTKFNEWVFDKRENERLTQGVTLLTNKLIDMKKEIENQSNEIDVLKDQVEWWKQQCDDLEMQIGENN